MVLDWIRFWLDAAARSYFTRFVGTANALPRYRWIAAKLEETLLFQRLTKNLHQGPTTGYEGDEPDNALSKPETSRYQFGPQNMGIQCLMEIRGGFVKRAARGELRDSAKHRRGCEVQNRGAGNHIFSARSTPIPALPFEPMSLRQLRAEARLRCQKARYPIHEKRTAKCRVQPIAVQADIQRAPFTNVSVTLPMAPRPTRDFEFVLNQLQEGRAGLSVVKSRSQGRLVTTSLVTNSNILAARSLSFARQTFFRPSLILHVPVSKCLEIHGNSGRWLPSSNTGAKQQITCQNQSNLFFENYSTKIAVTLV